ncbi:MAG: oligogalacturonate-specific porin KdgM [Bacteroidetes bacterium HLUCCA01]|nr:MAG: oligogalacturonate-specific porin KdgM [Bacteroidetes bacterium HLUCCA01]
MKIYQEITKLCRASFLKHIPTLLFLLTGVTVLPAHAQSGNQAKPEIFGTFRPVYAVSESRDRDGNTTTVSQLDARLQVNVAYRLRSDLQFRVRLAGRYSTEQSEFSFPLQSYTGPSGSYSAGVTTLDIIQLQWQAHPDLRITAGRFQNRHSLAGFIPRGLDRYYSANVGIAHTDGIWLQWNMNRNWRLDGVLNHNSVNGSSHAARAPMVFTEPASRVGAFANIGHRNTSGLWVQRELSISVFPRTFRRDGQWRNLTVITSRAMMRLPIHGAGAEYWAGAEIGFVPDAPSPADAGFPVASPLFETSSFAWQASAYANNLFERHTLGVYYGQTEPNWVSSFSYRANHTVSEFRYRYTINTWLNFEFRFRLRTDLYKRTDAAFTAREGDFYARFNVSF